MRRAMFLGPRFVLDHRFTQASASDYLDGELAPHGRRRVERHVSVCPRCRRLIETLQRTLVALGELRAERRPDVTEGVLHRLRRDA